MGRPGQLSLLPQAQDKEPASDECRLCAVPVRPILSAADEVIAWRCPSCGGVSKHRMQQRPPRIGE